MHGFFSQHLPSFHPKVPASATLDLQTSSDRLAGATGMYVQRAAHSNIFFRYLHCVSRMNLHILASKQYGCILHPPHMRLLKLVCILQNDGTIGKGGLTSCCVIMQSADDTVR